MPRQLSAFRTVIPIEKKILDGQNGILTKIEGLFWLYLVISSNHDFFFIKIRVGYICLIT